MLLEIALPIPDSEDETQLPTVPELSLGPEESRSTVNLESSEELNLAAAIEEETIKNELEVSSQVNNIFTSV